MQGRASIKIIVASKEGTTIKNFDLIFCDLINKPTVSSISERIKSDTNIITAYLKQINNVFIKNTLKLLI